MFRVVGVRLAAVLHQRTPDAGLVDLPPAVAGGCGVFRNALSTAQQNRMWEELTPLLNKQGDKTHVGGTRVNEKVLRNVSVDLHGFQDFIEIKDWDRMTDRRVPGLCWSPALVEFVNGIGKELLGGQVADSARVMEHHLPGYEMHVEGPTIGPQFLVLNLLAPSVMSFDNEGSEERGAALLPERSVLRCSSELRWGWRIGEHFHQDQVFKPLQRRVDADYRISIWLYKFNTDMVDRRAMSETIEAGVSNLATQTKKQQELDHDEADEKLARAHDGGDGEDEAERPVMTMPTVESVNAYVANKKSPQKIVVAKAGDAAATPRKPIETLAANEEDQRERRRAAAERVKAEREEEAAFAREALAGSGVLGGDLPAAKAGGPDPNGIRSSTSGENLKKPKNMADAQKKFVGYKQDLGRLGKVMERMSLKQEATGDVSEDWLRTELDMANGGVKPEDDPMGFEGEDGSGTWGDIEDRAQHYRGKLKAMNFDTGTDDATMKGHAGKMQQMKDDIVGEVPVEIFDPRKAARVIGGSIEEMRDQRR
jgi:hypothetical protein